MFDAWMRAEAPRGSQTNPRLVAGLSQGLLENSEKDDYQRLLKLGLLKGCGKRVLHSVNFQVSRISG